MDKPDKSLSNGSKQLDNARNESQPLCQTTA